MEKHGETPFAPKAVIKGRRPPMSGKFDDAEHIFKHLRALANRLGKQRLNCRDVAQAGEISVQTIIRRFGGFSEALIAAGLQPARTYKRNRQRMLADLHALIACLGRRPSKAEMTRNLAYNASHYEKEFGGVEAACRQAEAIPTAEPSSAPTPDEGHRPMLLSKSKSRRRYGPAIDFRGLRYAPVNEQGVVFLFGMLAEKLGFVVESVQDGFPDCDAKERQADGSFEGVRIEFEFRSSDFLRHKHDPDDCDTIVCWLHNWEDCPIHVISLSDVLKQQQHTDQGA